MGNVLTLKLYANITRDPVLYRHRASKLQRMFCARICQLLFQPYNLVVTAKSEFSIRNITYAISYSFMLSASKAVATVLACTQMILQFNGETKSQVVTQS